MAIEMPFHKWKKKFAPVIYEDAGVYCDEHDNDNDGPNACGCEYLRTWFLEELLPGGDDAEEYGDALRDCRVWTWQKDGRITSGVDPLASPADSTSYLITKRPWQTDTEVI